MEDIVESFAKRLGIEHKAARQGIAITCRHFLQVWYFRIKQNEIIFIFPKGIQCFNRISK